jgi:hypothetical protein
MTASANQVWKESQDKLKQFVKSEQKDIHAFSKEFIAQRAIYYKRQAMKDMLAAQL